MAAGSLKIEQVGPIKKAEVAFGDLTVLVGPQATGKSIFLQFLKLVVDTGYVHAQLRKHGIDWKNSPGAFFDVYFGEGMQDIWLEDEQDQPVDGVTFGGKGSKIVFNTKEVDVRNLARSLRRGEKQSVFYIPAQRVLSLANGWPRPFTSFASEDPFSIRDFSETFRLLMEQELGRSPEIFPKTNRLKEEYRKLLSQHIFGDFSLLVDRYGAQKRLVLKRNAASKTIPYLVWSAGQREFVPLLMGLYWLMPAARVKQRKDIKWVIIEEPEMGLHPSAISVVLLLVLELLWRGYRVCVSTHSLHVLDMIWALRVIQKHSANPEDVLELFGAPKTKSMREVASHILKKRLRVYYFSREGKTYDISSLDPSAEDDYEADWGGLNEFSRRASKVVIDVINKGGSGR